MLADLLLDQTNHISPDFSDSGAADSSQWKLQEVCKVFCGYDFCGDAAGTGSFSFHR